MDTKTTPKGRLGEKGEIKFPLPGAMDNFSKKGNEILNVLYTYHYILL